MHKKIDALPQNHHAGWMRRFFSAGQPPILLQKPGKIWFGPEGSEIPDDAMPINDDFDLLLADDQEWIATEVRRQADIARAYRTKFGVKHATDAHVAECLPLPPKVEGVKQ